jgi:hypothetical protein
MNRARVGIGSQSLGIAQAAYEEALNYAKAREQFGKALIEMPVISNMLIDMKVNIEANRTLYYNACEWLDKKEKYEETIEKLKSEKKSVAEYSEKSKEAVKVTAFLTPLSKYFLSESANKIAYDALQIHGGTGYMKEFSIERLFRDARITNIYEGTSQLQVVAASGGVINDVLAAYIDEWDQQEYKGTLAHLLEHLREIRSIYNDCIKYVKEKKDAGFQEVASKDLVEIYGSLYIGYLILLDANKDSKKIFTARRYILDALAKTLKSQESIKSELYSDVLHSETILQ